MKAAYINQPGPPENIIIGDLPTPEPTGSQVLVRVKAAALNPIDTYIRGGTIQMDIPLPFIVGCDLAGVVEKLGPDAKRFKVGDRVWGSNQGLLGRQGTFAEYAAVDECWLYPTPDGVSDEAAAACALVGITAHLGLVRDAKLQARRNAVRQRRHRRRRLDGRANGQGARRARDHHGRQRRKSERLPRAGRRRGHQLQNRRRAGPRQRVRARTASTSGGKRSASRTSSQTVPLLAPRGRMILMAGRDARPPFPVGPFYVKGCHLYGFAMFNATPDEQRAAADDINRWLAAGKLKPRIDRVLPLDQAAAAHRLQEESTVGKVRRAGRQDRHQARNRDVTLERSRG